MVQREAPTALAGAAGKVQALEDSLASVIRGKPGAVRLATVCLFAKGHLLIEDVPGVGKTTLAQALARSVRCRFHRIQFTADMLPSDVLGVTVYNAHTGEFEFKQGPVFTNILLADEINRATPKTQSALLEAMNELQVTIDGRSHPLDPPFMVVATQNPVEHHGTYPLPESQLDRFLMRIEVGYPDMASERQILRGAPARSLAQAAPVLNADEVVWIQEQVQRVAVEEALVDYILAIVEKTRTHPELSLGVSPRGAQALFRAVQSLALVLGRDYAIPDDVKQLAGPLFAHRLVLNARTAFSRRDPEAAARIIADILTQVDVPL
ncbi:MAG: MoxR family ATPase [Acidobacteria bacterium]|nr:MoxR family ATPase [Acidobacteriota bacterium]